MKIGYARVSTSDQNLELQLDALRKEGCEEIFQDKVSGVSKEKPGFDEMIKRLRKGDVVVIYKLDRLSRSLIDLVSTISKFDELGVGFKSLNDTHIDTTSPSGKFVFHLFSSLAEFERDLIRQRTQAGLKSARARGRIGGRPKGLSPKAEETAIVCETLYREGKLSSNAIAKQLNVSKATLYKYLKHRGVEIGSYSKVA